MAQITEIAPDLFRITTFLEPFNLQSASSCCVMQSRSCITPARARCFRR